MLQPGDRAQRAGGGPGSGAEVGGRGASGGAAGGIVSRLGLRGLEQESWVLFSLRTLNSVGFSMAMPFFGIYLLQARGVSLAETGLVYFAGGAAGLVSQIIGGRLTDSVGPKRVMLLGYASSIASATVLGFMILDGVSTYYFFLVYPLSNLFRRFSNPATASIIAGQEESKMRPGYNLLTIGGNLGFAIGPALGGPIADLFGYSTVFFISAASVVPVVALASAFIKGGIRHRPEDRAQGVERSLSWKRDRSLVSFLVLTGCLYVAVGYELIPLSLYVSEFLSLSNSEIGYLFATNGLVIVLLQFPLIGAFGRARRLILPLLVSPVLVIASFIIAAFSTSFLDFELVMVTITLGEILLTVPSQTVVALFSKAGNRGTYQGYYYAASSMGRSTASAVGPLSFQFLGFAPGLGWFAIALFTLLVFVGFAQLEPHIQWDYEAIRSASPPRGAYSPRS